MFAGYPVHHLPVLNQQEVVGMLSTADVMKLDLFLPKGSKSPIDYLNERMKVGQLVRRPVLTVQSHQSVETAAHLMAENGVHALPVVNAKNQLLGIISTTDIIAAALVADRDGPTRATPEASNADPQPMHARLVLLEEVRHIASRFMQAGQDQGLHSKLRKALNAVNRSEEHSTAQAARFETKALTL
jgi:CBS domain containing-hemolysin-like protein